MDKFELIALFLLSGTVAAGVSLPLNRYLNKILLWIICLLAVLAYTVLVSKQSRITADGNLEYTRVCIPLFVYLTNGITALLYIAMAFFCSYIYEKERKKRKNFRKNLFLNRRFGFIAGGFLAILLYCIVPPDNYFIFFSTAATMALPIFSLVFAYFIPCMLLFRRE